MTFWRTVAHQGGAHRLGGLDPDIQVRFRVQVGRVRRDAEAAQQPGFTGAVGGEQAGQGLLRRFHRQHVQPGAGQVAGV